MRLMITLFILFFSVFDVLATCDVKALEKRLATYKEVTEEATKDLKVKIQKVGCADVSKDSCDHEVMRQLYIEYTESYNKIMNGIIATENQDYGCPKDLINSLNKKEAK